MEGQGRSWKTDVARITFGNKEASETKVRAVEWIQETVPTD